jgi:hypothetical protein
VEFCWRTASWRSRIGDALLGQLLAKPFAFALQALDLRGVMAALPGLVVRLLGGRRRGRSSTPHLRRTDRSRGSTKLITSIWCAYAAGTRLITTKRHTT